MRHPDLGVAVLARVQVEHELRERALEPRHAAPQDGEARLGDPGGALQVEPERGADFLVRLRREAERPRLVPAAQLDVVVFALALGDRRVRQVRELERERLEPRVDRPELRVEPLDALADLAHARLFGAGVLAAALGLADQLGGLVAEGFEVFALADEPTALGVELDQLRDEVRAAFDGEPTAHRIGLLADQPDVKHGVTGLRPARGSPNRRARPSRPGRRPRGR